MTAREQDDRHRPVKSQDSEFIGAFAALRRAAVKARRRAFETTGAVAHRQEWQGGLGDA